MSIFHRLHINAVVIRVCPDPLDEHDLVRIVDGHTQPVAIAFDVENHSIRSDNAGIGISFQNIGWAFPARPERLMKPRIESRFDRLLVLAAFEAVGKSPQGLSRNDPHGQASDMRVIIHLVPKMGTRELSNAEAAEMGAITQRRQNSPRKNSKTGRARERVCEAWCIRQALRKPRRTWHPAGDAVCANAATGR